MKGRSIDAGSGLRFLISGGLNTLATFILYWALLRFVHYQAAYAISFVAGIALSYALNVRFVFRTSHTWRKLLLFPLTYLCTYAVGALVLSGLVAYLGLSEVLAPILVICVTVPLTYLLNRWVLTRGPDGDL